MPHETDRQPVESPSPQHALASGQLVHSPATELPHLLLRAFERLESALKDGIDQFKRKLRSTNIVERKSRSTNTVVCRAINRFVGEFCSVPAWKAELERRAIFVEEQWTHGSEFRREMDTALRQPRPQPKKAAKSGTPGPEFAIQVSMEGVRNRIVQDGIDGKIQLADEVVRVRETLELAIDRNYFESVKSTITQWIAECYRIQDKAKHIEADGCLFLHQVHLAVQANASDIHEGIIGGEWLKEILDAAESLMAWAQENPATRPSVTPKRLDAIDQPPEVTGEKSEIEDNSGSSHRFVFRRDGTGFYIAGFGESGHVGTSKGFRQIHRLIQTPRKPVPMLELVEAVDDKRIAADQRSRQPVLDCEARKQAAEELQKLMTERDKAKKNNDSALQENLQVKIERLCSQIKADTGLKGQSRDLNSELEKLRPTIWGSLKRAFNKLGGGAHPPMTELAKHFELSISSESGAFIYRPAGNAPDWSFETHQKVAP